MPYSCSAPASPPEPSAYRAAGWWGFSPYLRSATLVNVAPPNSGKHEPSSGGASTLPIQRRHRHVVRRGVGEGLGGQPLALLEGEPAGGDRGQHLVVATPGEVTMATDGWFFAAARTMDGPADVDLLDALVGARAGRDGLAERVEVGDDEVERLDAELGELLDVGVEAAVGEDAGVHLGVQRLDAAVEALGEPGQVLDLGDRDAERLIRAADPPVDTSATPASWRPRTRSSRPVLS